MEKVKIIFGSFWSLRTLTLTKDFKIKTCLFVFFLLLDHLKSNFIYESLWEHTTKMAFMSILGKNLHKSPSPEPMN